MSHNCVERYETNTNQIFHYVLITKDVFTSGPHLFIYFLKNKIWHPPEHINQVEKYLVLTFHLKISFGVLSQNSHCYSTEIYDWHFNLFQSTATSYRSTKMVHCEHFYYSIILQWPEVDFVALFYFISLSL